MKGELRVASMFIGGGGGIVATEGPKPRPTTYATPPLPTTGKQGKPT